VWGPQALNTWQTTTREAVAEFVDVPRPGDDEPGPFRYADVDRLLVLLDRAGFANLETSDWHGKIAIGGGLGPEDAADFALASFSSFGELLAQAGAEAREAAHRALTARFSSFEVDGAVRVDASVHVVTGR